LFSADRLKKGGTIMGLEQKCACRGRRSVRVRLVVPGLPLYGAMCVVLVVGVALWPAVCGVQAQEEKKAPPVPQPATAVPAPPAVLPLVPTQRAQPQSPPVPTAQPKNATKAVTPPVPANVVAIDDLVVFTGSSIAGGRRFQFTIDPKAPLKELLPAPPKDKGSPVGLLNEDLARVPEITFQQPLARELPPEKAQEQTALTIARINHLNKAKNDHFLEKLLETRADLAGLPVAMGEACRSTGERSREFKHAVEMVRQSLQGNAAFGASFVQLGGLVSATREVKLAKVREAEIAQSKAAPPPPTVAPAPVAVPQAAPAKPENGNSFWERFQRACASEDQNASKNPRGNEQAVTCARIAALMQVLAPESPALRLGLVKYLAGVSHVEATRALARLAIFSAEDEIRAAALNALKVRRERDYTAILLEGLRYPLPTVARRASEAVVKLERSDLVPQLVSLLEEPDPRAPVLKEVDHKRVPVVREVVRINHHKNCMLCHSPGNTGSVSPDTLTAAVPIPSQPLPEPSQGYDLSSPDILVRVDVTYLRQDFSMRLPVADANPWPEMQRFDFLVRSRVLTEPEAKAINDVLGKREPGVLSPYHRAVLAALRELTGRDTEPTPQAWRRLLGLAASEARDVIAKR
jgi:hypothetical protein